MQVNTDPDGRTLWLSPTLPGRTHDPTAARTHMIVTRPNAKVLSGAAA